MHVAIGVQHCIFNVFRPEGQPHVAKGVQYCPRSRNKLSNSDWLPQLSQYIDSICHYSIVALQVRYYSTTKTTRTNYIRPQQPLTASSSLNGRLRTKKRTRRRLVVSVRRVVTQQTIKCFGTKTEKTFSGELGLVKVPCVKKKDRKKWTIH